MEWRPRRSQAPRRGCAIDSLSRFVAARSRYAQVKTPGTLTHSEHDWSRSSERDHVVGKLGVKAPTIPRAGHFSAHGAIARR